MLNRPAWRILLSVAYACLYAVILSPCRRDVMSIEQETLWISTVDP